MMAFLNQLIQRFESLQVQDIIAESFEETAENYADLNAEQMYSGRNSEGDPITPTYTQLTVAYKKRKGQPADRVTLRDTGDFYQGIYAKLEGITITVGSADEKTKQLEEKYGEEIFGLDLDPKREFVFGPFLKAIQEKFTAITKLPYQHV